MKGPKKLGSKKMAEAGFKALYGKPRLTNNPSNRAERRALDRFKRQKKQDK
jgi:hypothetical protein